LKSRYWQAFETELERRILTEPLIYVGENARHLADIVEQFCPGYTLASIVELSAIAAASRSANSAVEERILIELAAKAFFVWTMSGFAESETHDEDTGLEKKDVEEK